MATSRQLSTAILPIFALVAVASSIGCSSLATVPNAPLAVGTDAEEATVTDPMVVVELRAGNEQREYLRAPLKGSMLVQDALKGSGAIHRFRRMNIVLVRRSDRGQKLRLPIQFNTKTRRVVNENNYAMHGGDWLEVSEDTSTTFDRMFQQVLQPLKPVMRSYRD